MSILTKPKYLASITQVLVPLLALSALASEPRVEFQIVPCLESPFKPPICGGIWGNFYQASFIDLDDDGDLDAMIGLTNGTIAYFENVGNVKVPVFEQRFDTDNPLKEVDVEDDASISLVDLDDDGDFDAIIGGSEKELSYYENVGTASLPQFEQRTKHPLDEINVGSSPYLSIVDLDNDSDLDVVIGNNYKISYYENVGNASQPQFKRDAEHPLTSLSGASGTSLVDLDNDGDLDAVIYDVKENINIVKYYENVGNARQPQFEAPTEHPFSDFESRRDYRGELLLLNLVDLDNDGDLDAFQVTDNGRAVRYYENVGNANQAQFEPRINPLGGVSVGFDAHPNMVDLDNDGDWDAVIGNREGKLSYYENIGSTEQPQFEHRIEHALSEIDVGYGAVPSLADLDNDGDLDAIFGNYDKINYYKNVGSTSQPVFESCTTPTTSRKEPVNDSQNVDGVNQSSSLNKPCINPLSEVDASLYLSPSVVDLDNDSDWDLVIGHDNGKLSYYENVGSANQPQFQPRTVHPLSEVDVGSDASPRLVDLDNDGDWDALIGNGNFYEDDRNLSYYENVGSASQPRFEKRTEHPLDGVGFGGKKSPSLVDLDNDGDLDAVIGNTDGIFYYENVGNANQPQFKSLEHPLNENDLGYAVVDLDNDGDLDAIGQHGERIGYYENVGNANQPVFEECSGTATLFCGVDVDYNAIPNLVDLDHDGDLDAVIGNWYGKINYYENVGDASQPRFEQRAEHALSHMDVMKNSSAYLSLGDLDNDQDLDAIIGNYYGQLYYYENVGSVNQPQFEQHHLDHPLNDNSVFSNLADLDNDGDLDIVMKGIDFDHDHLSYYENVGSASQPMFEKHLEHFLIQLVLIQLGEVDDGRYYFIHPNLIDLDKDGDLDVVIGKSNGQLSYYKNVGSASQPQFEQHTNLFNGVDVGWHAFPSLADLDKDGDLDAIIGNSSGQVKYYENVGSTSQPIFEGCRNSSNPFCEINIEGRTYPRLADLDSDGDLDALIGSSAQLSYYENVGNVNQPQFELRPDHPLSWNKEGYNRIVPSLGDLDNDGDWDVVVGVRNADGVYVSYYENVSSISQPRFEQRLAHPLDIVKANYPTPYPHLVDLDNDGDLDAVIGNDQYYENVGNASQPVFEERPDHPLSQIYVYDSYSSLVDLDNDGDKDAFIGDRYYVNTQYHVLPPNRALPKGGLYSKPREVNLVCLDCETIYYTLDGSTPTTESLVFTEPFNLAESTTLKFLTVDAKGQQSKIITEKYVFDTEPPQITITLPTDRKTMVEIADIRGTADDPGGSGLRRIELNIFSAPLYLQGNHRAIFDEEEIQWLPVKYKKNWFYDLSAVSFPVGTYKITARAFDSAGNMSTDTITVYRATQARTDLFLKLDSATLLGGKSLNATGTLVSRRFPAIEEDLKGQEIHLLITAPDGTTRTETTQIQSNIGQFEFKDLGGFDQEGAYSFTARFAETDLLTQADSEAQSVLVGQSAGYAVIVMGQIANGEGLEAHNKTTNRIYKTLKERGFEDDNIFYFNPNLEQETCKVQNGQEQCTPIGIDGQPTAVDFVNQVEGLAERINGSPAPFYFILVNHGDQDGNFYIHDTDSGLEYVTPETWAGWLDAVEAELNDKARAKPRFILLGYCYSGKTLESLTKPGRIVISSAADNEVSYKGPKEPDGIRAGEYFMEEFFGHLGRGESFYTAFQNATARTELFTRRGGSSSNATNRFNDQAVQHPLLAFDGHEGYNDLGAILLQSAQEVRQADKEEVPLDLNKLYLGVGADYDTNYVGNPAAIDSVTETLYLEPDETSAELFLMVNNAARVKEAAVNVRLPSTQLTSESEPSENPVQQVEIQALKEINLLCDFDNRCARQTDDLIPNLFTEPGKYELYYFVADNETQDISKILRSVVYKNKADNQPPEPVELLTPTDGGEEQATTLLFSWEATTDPDGLTYTLMIAEDADFNNVVYRQEELTQTQLLVSSNATALRNGTPLELEDATEYYWKVEAVDHFGAKTPSQVRRFQTNYTNCRVMTPSGTIRPGFDGRCPNGSFLTTLPFPPYCPNTYVCQSIAN